MSLPLQYEALLSPRFNMHINHGETRNKFIGVDLVPRHELFLLGEGEQKVTYVLETRKSYPAFTLHCA